jgi:pseudouridine-5'-phosphate glycosidase
MREEMRIAPPARVALESTLIAHGLPWPDNLATARGSEAAVREAGAEPATVVVLAGSVRVGIGPEELERLAGLPAGTILKAGRRDLAWAVARGLDAATTVGATLWIARRHGIDVMATGGLGGVHRGADRTFDVSADLDELARADGALVVCSGVKSILDVAATLEVLETRGVPVVGYRTDDFPAFTTVSSGLAVEARVDSPTEAADLVRAHRRLGLPGAIVLAQPPPADLAIPRKEMEAAVADALLRAQERGIAGKAITPFLLDAIRESTSGRSLAANKALIVANARLAGEVAAELGGLVR